MLASVADRMVRERDGFALSVAATGGALLLGIFGALTQDVVWNDDAALRDPGITDRVIGHRTAVLTDVMKVVTRLGSALVLVPLVVVCGLLLWRKRRALTPIVQLAVVYTVAWGVAGVTKEIVDRQRPPVQDWLVHVSGPSFPSQHAAAAAAVFGMLAALLMPTRGWGARIGIAALAVLITVSVAASRVYLGVHWFTDVFAGAALGGGVAVVAVAVGLWTGPRAGDPNAQPAEGPNARNGSGS